MGARPVTPDGRTASTQANHTRRLAKAAKGEWDDLIREYVTDLIETDPRTNGPDQQPQREGAAEQDHPADQKTLERAAKGAREGAVVAAAATLVG